MADGACPDRVNRTACALLVHKLRLIVLSVSRVTARVGEMTSVNGGDESGRVPLQDRLAVADPTPPRNDGEVFARAIQDGNVWVCAIHRARLVPRSVAAGATW